MPSSKQVAKVSENTLIIEPGRAARQYWADLWSFRELFFILAWRDIAVMYKQTAIGVAWALVRPLITVAIFSGIFGGLAQLPSEGSAPYPIMVMAGTLPWFLFSTIVGNGSNSLITNRNLISKIYFPRLIVPVASSVVALVDFTITFVLLLCLMVFFSFVPDWRILLLPAFIILAIVSALGPALIMATLNVKYRDFRIIVPFIVQFGIYVSPVGFTSAAIPEEWRLLYSLNPVVGVIDGFRWCLLGQNDAFYLPGFLLSVGIAFTLLWLGIRKFRKTERLFADFV